MRSQLKGNQSTRCINNHRQKAWEPVANRRVDRIAILLIRGLHTCITFFIVLLFSWRLSPLHVSLQWLVPIVPIHLPRPSATAHDRSHFLFVSVSVFYAILRTWSNGRSIEDYLSGRRLWCTGPVVGDWCCCFVVAAAVVAAGIRPSRLDVAAVTFANDAEVGLYCLSRWRAGVDDERDCSRSRTVAEVKDPLDVHNLKKRDLNDTKCEHVSDVLLLPRRHCAVRVTGRTSFLVTTGCRVENGSSVAEPPFLQSTGRFSPVDFHELTAYNYHVTHVTRNLCSISSVTNPWHSICFSFRQKKRVSMASVIVSVEHDMSGTR